MNMKRFVFIISALSALFLAGCNNAEYQPKNNILYLSDAAQGTKSSTVEKSGGVDLPILVRLAQKATEDVEVKVNFNPAILDQLNSAGGTDYLHVEEGLLPKDASVTIPAGSVSASYQLHIDDFETNGATYAIAVQLGDVVRGGDIPVSSQQGHYVYILSEPLIVSVPVMQPAGSEMVTAAPAGDWGIQTEDWTIEAWVRMNGFSINNQALFDSGNRDKGCEIYIRFGDANRPYNYLQAKILGHNGMDSARDFDPNKWYHLAIVCTKSDKTVRIYRNGELIISEGVTYPADGIVHISHLDMISSSRQYFRNECAMSQVRLWKVGRTQQEIQNNMYFSVNAKNPDLIAYWPMDEGEGTTFKDITGNGHDATTESSLVRRWEHDIRFDGK